MAILKKGLKADYEALVVKDESTIYFITDTGEIYVGATAYGTASISEADLAGFAHDVTWNATEYKLTIPQVGGAALVVDIPKDAFVAGVSYDGANGDIILALTPEAGGGTVTIPATDLVGMLYGTGSAATDTVVIDVGSDRKIKATIKVDEASGLAIGADGTLALDLSGYGIAPSDTNIVPRISSLEEATTWGTF